MKKHRHLLALIVLLWVSSTQIHAQHSLRFDCNAIRPDSINRIPMPYFDAGCEGENVTWDFSHEDYDANPDTTSVSLYDMKNRLLWDDNGTMTTYRQTGDSLIICREETPRYEMDFDIPIVRMIYPFFYGQTITSPFSGKGIYEDVYALNEKGYAHINGDAYGTLILAEGDTLKNVLRVHTTLQSDMDITTSSTGEYVGTLTKVADTYEWYARGYRYPVLKTTSNYIISEGNAILTRTSAQRISPEMQEELDDEENEELRRASDAPSIINYDVTVNGNTVTITYDLMGDAHIGMTLADSKGIVYWRHEEDRLAGEGYQTQVPLAGLLRGQYVIYINVNGEISNCKVNVE